MNRPPMYEIIYQDLVDQITSGALVPEQRLASEAELAEQYGVSRMTVRQALGRLEGEQMVVRRRGAGTFVASPRSTYRHVNRLGPFEVGVGDAQIRTLLRVQEVTVPGERVRHRLGLKPRQKAVRLVRVRLVNGVPASIQDSWLPYGLAPALAREPLVGGSLYRTLSERCGIQLRWAEQEVSASAATREQAEWLGVAESSPLVTITRLAYTDGTQPVEFAHSWTRPEFPLLMRLDA